MSKHFNLIKIKLLTYHLLTALTLVSQSWGLSVLLVEDDSSQMKIYDQSLRSAGSKAKIEKIEISWVRNGLEALDLMKGRAFDIIITDFNMPCMDGDTFCRTFIKENPLAYNYDPNQTQVFAHTTNVNFDKIDGVKTKFIEAGVDKENIFEKPKSIRKIIKMIFNI